MSLKRFVFLFIFVTVLDLTTSEPGSSDVLSRLTRVEDKIVTIHGENEELRLENTKLLIDNKKLKASFRVLASNFELQKKESQDMKKRLGDAEREISVLKSNGGSFERVKALVGNTNMHAPLSESSGGKSSGSEQERPLTEHNKRLPRNRISDATAPKTSSSKKNLPGSKAEVRRISRLLSSHLGATAVVNKVSFSAHMGQHMSKMGINQKLIFEVVNNNEGGGYDKLTGVFTCPVSGTYFFSVSVLSQNGDEIHASIAFNNIDRAYIDADAPAGKNTHGYNSLIIHCNKGDDVWIRNLDHDSYVYGSKYSQFAGFILWAD